MRIALIQPEIPQNTGAVLRLAACLGVGVDIVEPCGFVWSDTRLRRAGMDYLDRIAIRRHPSWERFVSAREGRLVLLTTKGTASYTSISFRTTDTLVLGNESSGAPTEVHAAADLRVAVPMAAGMRSLNMAMAAAIVLGEALRQTDGFPDSVEE